MEKLDKETIEELTFDNKNKRKKSDLILKLDTLEVSEGIFIPKESWELLTPPGAYISQTFRKDRSEKKFSTKSLTDGSGFISQRIK